MAPNNDPPDTDVSPAKEPTPDQTPDRRVTPSETTEELSHSTASSVGILADTHTRYVLYYLRERDGRGTLHDIADQLAAWEQNTTVELTTGDGHNRVKSRLYHAALPKLDDYGFITFDVETETVTATDQLDRLDQFLDFAQTMEPDEYEQFRDLLQTEGSDGDLR